jgi:peptidoglycan/xylan/chitin deacetylase (PgdA/CDA1 family)
MKILFSFDDNHVLNMKVADMLEKYGHKATFFINIYPLRKHIGNELSTVQIRNLHERGFEIGAHAMSHKPLTRRHSFQRAYELQRSKALLEGIIKDEVQGFCYPKGQYNLTIMGEVKEAGYKYARTTGEGCTELNNSDIFKIVPTVQIYDKPYRKYLRIKGNLLNSTGFSWTGGWKESVIKFINASKEVVHIYGHSWEIEEQDLWFDLEELLAWIQVQGYRAKGIFRGCKVI